MDVLVRDAATEDLAVLQDVFRRASLSNEGDRGPLLEHPEALDLDASTLFQGRCRVAVIDPGGVVGFATTTASGDRLELVDLFVDPDWMRRGVARRLIDDVRSFARAEGIARVEVDGNPHALAFYEDVGFTVTSEVQTELGQGYRLHLDVSA